MAGSFQRKEIQTSVDFSVWSYRTNPVVKEFLNHVAEELAIEYARLMERESEEREV